MSKEDTVQTVIDRLEAMPKHGVSYDEKGRHGFRNPIRGDTGPLLTALTKIRNPIRILEIGTAHGLSACYIAKGAPNARLTTIEWDEVTALEAQETLNEAGVKAEVICGDAMKVIEALKSRLPYEVVFMDANKDGYLEQFQALQTNRLLAPRCLILADNVIDRQTECQNFLDYMKAYDATIIETECGLLVATV